MNLGFSSFSQRAVLEKKEVILGIDCDGDDDNSAFSCFLLFFLRGEEGKDGVVDCCGQIKMK